MLVLVMSYLCLPELCVNEAAGEQSRADLKEHVACKEGVSMLSSFLASMKR